MLVPLETAEMSLHRVMSVEVEEPIQQESTGRWVVRMRINQKIPDYVGDLNGKMTSTNFTLFLDGKIEPEWKAGMIIEVPNE